VGDVGGDAAEAVEWLVYVDDAALKAAQRTYNADGDWPRLWDVLSARVNETLGAELLATRQGYVLTCLQHLHQQRWLSRAEVMFMAHQVLYNSSSGASATGQLLGPDSESSASVDADDQSGTYTLVSCEASRKFASVLSAFWLDRDHEAFQTGLRATCLPQGVSQFEKLRGRGPTKTRIRRKRICERLRN